MPTALFYDGDMYAAVGMRMAWRAGLRIPEDVSVVGYDNAELSQALKLTTVAQQFESIGRNAVTQLLVKLVVRETTAPPGDWDQ